MTPGVDAAIFYLSVVALIAGGMRAVRASVESKSRDRLGVVLATLGFLGLALAVAGFIAGPKTVLPF